MILDLIEMENGSAETTYIYLNKKTI
jgi:hypothetical protein